MSNLRSCCALGSLRLKSLQITHFRFGINDLHLAGKPSTRDGCRCPRARGRRGRIAPDDGWESCRRRCKASALVCLVCPKATTRAVQAFPRARARRRSPAGAARRGSLTAWSGASVDQIMTRRRAAKILRLPTSTLANLLHPVIRHAGSRDAYASDGLTTKVDDKLQGPEASPRLDDWTGSAASTVGPGQGPRHHRSLLQRLDLSRGQCRARSPGPVAMSPTVTSGRSRTTVRTCLVIDRFHLVKALNQADEVREQWRALDTQGRKAIKGLRWLSRHSRPTQGTRFLNSLRNSNRRIHRAWVLKDEFEHFWNYRYRASAKKFLRRW